MDKKKPTVKEKLYDDISLIISNKLNLTHLPEFEEYNQNYFEDKATLFIEEPKHWSELEIAICDYTMRIQTELQTEIKNLLSK